MWCAVGLDEPISAPWLEKQGKLGSPQFYPSNAYVNIVQRSASRLLAWILSRIVGASVGFRGAVESVSVGEIKLSLRQSLVKLGMGIISKDPKLQTAKATIEVKELKVDISKDGGSKPNLSVKLHILPISVHYIQMLSGIVEKPSTPFIYEEFSLSCEFGHGREAVVVVRNVDINCEEIVVNLNEELLSKNKKPPVVGSTADSITAPSLRINNLQFQH
ncbi:hypothetical protein PTKIN_Ptkin09bG0031100 [Pterospermum kingtungense]